MKRYARTITTIGSPASKFRLEEFMKYHEDRDNYLRNRIGFDKMYQVLEKYGDQDEDVDVVFMRATAEDQLKMIELIKPTLLPGQSGYAKQLYHRALARDIENASNEYCMGIVDMIHALVSEGMLVNDNSFN